jgi:CPA2 family monovalent cation:H+ antiporter-2
MDIESQNLKIVMILTFGFAFASILGYFSQKLKLSPILGYLLAGYVIGPFSPGIVADLTIAEQLAEIGVIMMMFGVGLHFKWKDLVEVRNIAIPGAIGQTAVAATSAALVLSTLGWSWETGILIGLGIGVASTVVLVRVLFDNNLLDRPEGHIAVGWLIVEDILTVIILIILPTIATLKTTSGLTFQQLVGDIVFIILKFILLFALMFTVGQKIVSYVFLKIARTRSSELFTLTIFALTFVIATGSTFLFGTSIALGAFLAGMVIGGTHVRHQVFANSLPMKDAFVVIFFLTVGMLFNPNAIVEHFSMFLAVLFIILIIKPLAAFVISILLRHPFKTALTVSLALAQIGEFSFILTEEAMRLNMLPDEGFDVIVACALISIAANPILFKYLDTLMIYKEKRVPSNYLISPKFQDEAIKFPPKAVVVGFGPIGQSATQVLEQMGFSTIVVDHNVDTVASLIEEKHMAVYGDAALANILDISQVKTAELLIITIPEISKTIEIIHQARNLNPGIRILARTRYSNDQMHLHQLNVAYICCEIEAIKAFREAIVSLKASFHLA